jgi:putative phosphoribosyl transferase
MFELVMGYADRRSGGRALAAKLAFKFEGRNDLVVLALPPGGIPVGYEAAHRLSAPLDIAVVVALVVRGHEDLAIGAIAWNGMAVLNPEVVYALAVAPGAVAGALRERARELKRRERAYRGDRPPETSRARRSSSSATVS